MEEPTESDRLVAALRGNTLAIISPVLWKQQEKIRLEKESGMYAERDRLRAKLQAEIKRKLNNGVD